MPGPSPGGAGTTLTIATNDTFTLTGAATLAGTIAGAGTLALTGGTQALTAGATLSVSTWSVGGGAAIDVNENLSYAGTFSEDSNSSLTVASGETFSLTGAATMAGAVDGGGALFFTNGSASIIAGATLGVASLYIQSGASVTLNENLSYAGTLATAAGTTLALGANTLSLTGQGTTLQGAMTGTGALVFAGGDQTFYGAAPLSMASWSLSGGDLTGVDAAVTYGGTFSEDATSTVDIASGDTLTFSGAATLAGTVAGAGTLVFAGGTQALNTGAMLSVSAWSVSDGTATAINENLTYAGALFEDATSTITTAAGDTLTLTGTENLAGTVGGAGTVAFAAGSTLTIASGSTLTLSGKASLAGAVSGTGTLALGAGAAVAVNESLTFAGGFTQGAATMAIGAGNTLSLTGAATFGPGAVVNGAGILALTDATLAGLTVGGTVTLSDADLVMQTGTFTLGDATNSAAKLTIAEDATWDIDGDVGIARGKAKKSAITVAGTLVKSTGTGESVINVKVTDNGLIEVASGTLDFTQALGGKSGAMNIDAGATLELGNKAAKTLTATFAGAGAVLVLGKAAKFASTIAGFTAGNTIDLLKTAATSASVNAKDQLMILDGTKTVATLQLTGSYAGDTFNVTSDGAKGSDITVNLDDAQAAPATGRFAQAMAGLGGGRAAQAMMPSFFTAAVQTWLISPEAQAR